MVEDESSLSCQPSRHYYQIADALGKVIALIYETSSTSGNFLSCYGNRLFNLSDVPGQARLLLSLNMMNERWIQLLAVYMDTMMEAIKSMIRAQALVYACRCRARDGQCSLAVGGNGARPDETYEGDAAFPNHHLLAEFPTVLYCNTSEWLISSVLLTERSNATYLPMA